MKVKHRPGLIDRFTGPRTHVGHAAAEPRYWRQALYLALIVAGLGAGFWALGWLLSAVLR